MKNIYFINIFEKKCGLTNQIFSLITGILVAVRNNKRVVICDEFSNDLENDSFSKISNIFDIKRMNNFLKKEFNILLFDRRKIDFNIEKVLYGSFEGNKLRNVTKKFNEHFVKNNDNVFVDKSVNMNKIFGDPCVGIVKNLQIEYKINEFRFKCRYGEYLEEDINFNVNRGNYIYDFQWINSIDQNGFDKILSNIFFRNFFTKIADLTLSNLNSENINVLHLRLENDGIVHWSRMNGMTQDEYRDCIEEKYIGLIKKYVKKDDVNIILSYTKNGRVFNFLNKNKYKSIFIPKNFKNMRELNAIVDFTVSKKCNNIFIGNFNPVHLNGSSFTYLIMRHLPNYVKQVLIDLDRIVEPEKTNF